MSIPRTDQPTDRLRRRAWFGTDHHIAEETLLCSLESGGELPDGVAYIAFQEEKGESSGALHHQIYIELDAKRDLSWLKENISATAHWEPRKGNARQANEYCTKRATRVRGPWIIGKMSLDRQGKRNDISEFLEAIVIGKRKRDLWQSHTTQMCRYRHMYNDYHLCHKPKRTTSLSVVLLVGLTGTGKTRTISTEWEKHGFWRMPISNGTMWFDGYDFDGNVLIDDFGGRRSKVRLDVLLNMIDWYVISVPVKGGYGWWCPTNICITSNFHPYEWYDYEGRHEQYRALKRRFTKVIIFGPDGPRLAPEDYWETCLPPGWKKP